MDKNVIYNRVSTLEQNPDLQIGECKSLAQTLGLENYEVIQEHRSAFKDIEREAFEQIQKAIERREVRHLLVWDLDRLFRKRKKLVAFFTLCKMYNCHIHSVRQRWLETIHTIPEPFNEIMYALMIQIMGWLAEEESIKKSERTKNAIRKEGDITVSYKGNKWGRRNIPPETKEAILEAYKQKQSYAQICSEVFYWNKNRNKKFVSKGLVHKVIAEFNEREHSL